MSGIVDHRQGADIVLQQERACRLRVGDTIEWINKDFVDHTATEQRGQWDVALPSDASRRLLARKAGTFVYFCRFHPQMKGVIHVGIP